LTAEADISITLEQGAPRFEGSLQFARPVGRAPVGAQALIIEPWRLAGRIKGDGKGAQLEQIEFQYGPDNRATKLRGNANVVFGQQPAFVGALSSPQIDLDRLLGLSEATRRRPLVAVRTLAESFVGAFRMPVTTTLTVGVEAMTLGGAVLQRVAAEVTVGDDHLDIKALELRAPGLTQVRLNGRIDHTATGVRFQGSSRVEANDARALFAWLADRSDAQGPGAPSPMRLGGEVSVGNDGITIDQLSFELDRMAISGRFRYAGASAGKPARLDAAFAAPEIDLDLDRAHAVVKAVLGDASFDWPREGALSLAIARAAVAGVEAKDVDVRMRVEPGAIEIQRLAVADFGGAALTVAGRIDTRAHTPHGRITLDLDARAFDGIVALAQRLAPATADSLQRAAGRLAPARLKASLALDPGASRGAEANARLRVDGCLGLFRVALEGDGVAAADAFKIENLAALSATKVHVAGRLEADDGGRLVELTGLDRILSVDQRPGRLTLAAIGPLDGQLAVEGQLVAGALNVASNGTVRLMRRAGSQTSASAGPGVGLDLKVANARIRSPRPAVTGHPPDLLPASLQARVALADGKLRFSEVRGTIAGTAVGGRLAIGLHQQPTAVEGELEIGAVDLPAAVATLMGSPAPSSSTSGSSARSGGHWPADPFEQTPYRLDGQIALKSARVALTPRLAAGDVRATLRFGAAEVELQVIDGTLASGRVNGELVLLRLAEGLTARGRVKLVTANAAELLPGEGSLTGRITLDAAAEGTGLSAVALIGSLGGNLAFKLENARLGRFDPGAFDAVIRAVDQGLPIDAGRIGERMEIALATGGLAIPIAEGTIRVNSGQARLSDAAVRAQGAELAVSGNVDLAQGDLDARLTLSGAAGATAGHAPDVVIALKGPLETPKRTIDVAAFSNWLALRAVEQQSRKLDVLEGRAPPAPAAPAAASGQSKAARTEADPVQSRPPAKPASKPKPQTAEPAPPLPAPVDIRPAPAPRATGVQSRAAAPPPAPPPPRPRSLSEILFGR
jgi:AsmA-like C-terminal region